MLRERTFLKWVLLLLGIVLIPLVIVMIPSVHNDIAKKALIHYVNKSGVGFLCSDVVFTSSSIQVKDFSINYHENKIESNLAEIKYDMINLLFGGSTDFDISSSNLSLNNKIVFDIKIPGNYNRSTQDFSFKPSVLSKFVVKNSIGLEKVNFTGNFDYSNNTLTCDDIILDIGEGIFNLSSNLKFNDLGINEFRIKGEVTNLSLMIYKILLHHQNPIYKHFESVPSGTIKAGKFEISLPPISSESYKSEKIESPLITIGAIKAYSEFEISDLEYIYDSTLPSVKSRLVKLIIDQGKIIIDPTGAVIADNIVKNGEVICDYLEDDIKIIINGNLEGDAKSLLEFVNPESLRDLKDSKVDLEKLTGKSKTKVSITIPIKEGSMNIYDIRSRIENANLEILDSNVKFTNYGFDGIFDGKKIVIKGDGLINEFKSSTSMNIDLDTLSGGYQYFSKITLGKIPNYLPQDSDELIFKDGESILLASITNTNDQTLLSMKADLTNLHFYIPSIAMDKLNGKKAKFTLDGQIDKGAKQMFLVRLSGEEGLNIEGKIHVDDHKSRVVFDQVKYYNNDFKAELFSDDKFLVANISGNLIDLSDADFSKFFKGGKKNAQSYKVNINLDQIKLKNGVNFTNALLDAECFNGDCYVANFNSSIDNKGYITLANNNHIIKSARGPKSQWELETNNAGKFLAAVGISNKIKDGVLKARLDSHISGDLSSANKSKGVIEMTRFKSKENQFLTKIVSFISIPGLLGALGNQDIYFDKSLIEFTLQNNLINLDRTSTEGPYFNFYGKGYIDLSSHVIKVKGQVAPSLYGLNQILGLLPFIKFWYGHRKGLIMTPFYYNDRY